MKVSFNLTCLPLCSYFSLPHAKSLCMPYTIMRSILFWYIGVKQCIYGLIITDSVVLWTIQKFDWLKPETKWHSCLHNRALCSYLATLRLLRQRENNPQFSGTYKYRNVGNYKFWMLILVLLCEHERQRWDASLRAFMYRDTSHLWRSFSHNRTKINIQFLNKNVPRSLDDSATQHIKYSILSDTLYHNLTWKRLWYRLLYWNPSWRQN